MPDIRHLTERPRWIIVEFQGCPWKIAYDPGRLTPRFAREMQERVQGNEAMLLVAMLAGLVTGWDLTNGEGEASVEISRESLEALPQDFLTAILDAITKDAFPASDRDQIGRFVQGDRYAH